MKLLIRNALLIYPEREFQEKRDIYIENGIIKEIGDNLHINNIDEVIDGEGKIIVPSMTDMHTHLREPGFEWKEDLLSGSMSAVAGGFTSIACMPNTSPPLDQRSFIEYIYKRTKEINLVNIYPIGTITKGREGKELSEMGDMYLAGAKGFSDDGSCVMNSEILRCALEYSKIFNVPIIEHCEDINLTLEGSINWGKTATLLGLKGMPWTAEASIVARDIFLAQLTQGKLHIAHVSCWQSIEMIRWAKKYGIKVSCEVTPHHLILTEDYVKETNYDANTKVNPPLRTKEDQESLWKALEEDIIDVIVSDHAPHHQDDKLKEYDLAEFGISGLETLVPLVITYGYFHRKLSLPKLLKKISYNPSKILNIPYIPLEKGNIANLTIIDLKKEKIVNPLEFFSKGKNTPFKGWNLKGWPILTIVNGKIVFREGKILK
ncbi:MAG: dihydroorotase [Dictyoglomus sp.]|nr:dihydroorotase [Dictyoglomus sp.]MDW8188640.1 dihydroorotase [Dictyoglomus sp.]